MSLTLDPSLQSSACCQGMTITAPREVSNLPGLSAIAYRIGTHASFKNSLLSRLSSREYPALQGLQTRQDSDFTIALLDAWSVLADVLTFYQERIANESYLRTASERRSLVELARLIGYQVRPGLAASVFLAFSVEDAHGAPGVAVIPAGTKVMSIPGPGELPQTYETGLEFNARAEWNVLRPRLSRPHPLRNDLQELFLEGIATNLKAGDGLLLVPDEDANLTEEQRKPVFRTVLQVTPQPEKARTRVSLKPVTTAEKQVAAAGTSVVQEIVRPAYSPITRDFLHRKKGYFPVYELAVAVLNERVQVRDVFVNLSTLQPPAASVLAFRARLAVFGHNAPTYASLPVNQRIGERNPETNIFIKGIYSGKEDEWVDKINLGKFPGEGTAGNLVLDNIYPAIVPQSWIILKDNQNLRLFQVQETEEVTRSEFTLTAKATRLKLGAAAGDDLLLFQVRQTTVYAQSEELPLARLPIEQPLVGDQIELDRYVDGLYKGQVLILSGELDEMRGVSNSEVAVISEVEAILLDGGFTRIKLAQNLANRYVRATVSINANVLPATHGETRQEVLGSGDARLAFQKFTLRQPPLTYLSASTESGFQAALELRVNQVLWKEVPNFFGRGATERIYTLRTGDDGRSVVQFGDGGQGARLPTGSENVQVTYRKGVGLQGLVKAGQLSLLTTRPLGVRSVTNPLPASGAADVEGIAEVRRSLPLTVQTLGRIVSLQDYQDYAAAFPGVAKALATWSWSGEQRKVFLTVAGPGGEALDLNGPVYKNLLSALRQYGDPYVLVEVKNYRKATFTLSGSLKIHPDYPEAQVLADAERSLRQAFAFDQRAFGQDVTQSEVIQVLQALPGVVAVDLGSFYRTDRVQAKVPVRLPADTPAEAGDLTLPAELLTLDPLPLSLGKLP
jgi:predicted phage baseplate assembly protein